MCACVQVHELVYLCVHTGICFWALLCLSVCVPLALGWLLNDQSIAYYVCVYLSQHLNECLDKFAKRQSGLRPTVYTRMSYYLSKYCNELVSNVVGVDVIAFIWVYFYWFAKAICKLLISGMLFWLTATALAWAYVAFRKLPAHLWPIRQSLPWLGRGIHLACQSLVN